MISRTPRMVLMAALAISAFPVLMPSAAKAGPTTAPTAIPKGDADDKYVPELRKARTELQKIRDMLDKEAVDPKGYRHKARDYISKAIDEMSAEIGEYVADDKK